MKVQVVVATLIVAVLLPLKYVTLDYWPLYGVVAAAVAMYVPKLLYFDNVVRRHIALFVVHGGPQVPL
jgi:hypothetical protein